MITGSWLLRKRKALRLSQAEAAAKAGISQAHLSKIENSVVDPRLSTINKLLGLYSSPSEKMVKSIMCKSVISVKPSEHIRKVSAVMKKKNISQVPVIRDGVVIGSVSEDDIINNLRDGLGDKPVSSITGSAFPIVHEEEPISKIKDLVIKSKAVLVSRKGGIVGIVTKYDLLKLVE